MIKKWTIILLCLFSINISAQNIPNGGFEIWDTNGAADYPVNWLFMNSPVCTPTMLPATQTDDSYEGNWAVKLVSHTCIGMPGTNLEVGFIYTGNLGGSTINNYSIPFNERPDNLSFFYKFYPEGNDSAFVLLMLVKYDTIELEITDTVAYSTGYIQDEVDEYTPFTLPITYLSENTPDYMYLIFTTSKTLGPNTIPISFPGEYANLGTTLIIDNVSAEGGTLGIDSKANLESAIMVYPNPAHDVLMIKKPENIQLQRISLFNNIGREVIQFNNRQTTFNIRGLKPGLYFLKLHTDKGVIVKKIIVK
jgi:hypothetical protein